MIMKKILLLVLVAFIQCSCSVSNDSDRSFILLPIDSVVMPTTFTVGNISTIRVKYKRPTDCYIFDGFYVNVDQNTRTIAVQSVQLTNVNCQPDDVNVFEVNFDYKPTVAGTYTFKFWVGPDTNNVDQYETYEVEVL
jgi:hypothetical protein